MSNPNSQRSAHFAASSRTQRFGDSLNNQFYDRPVEERAFIMERACEKGGEANFFDLSPQERAQAYDSD